jgi:hypothetical protein
MHEIKAVKSKNGYNYVHLMNCDPELHNLSTTMNITLQKPKNTEIESFLSIFNRIWTHSESG